MGRKEMKMGSQIQDTGTTAPARSPRRGPFTAKQTGAVFWPSLPRSSSPHSPAPPAAS